MDIELIGLVVTVVVGLIAPLYFALYQLHKELGEVKGGLAVLMKCLGPKNKKGGDKDDKT